MFNIYYINYAKAYEIAMLQNNKIKTSEQKENNTEFEGDGKGNISTSDLKNIPLIGKMIPDFSIDAGINGKKSWNVIDTVNVVSTKSTILNQIYKKAEVTKDISKEKIGKLIKIDGVELSNTNINDILAVKSMQSGIFNKVDIEGLGDVNITSLMEVLLKDSSYIFEGKDTKQNNIIIKIPMQMTNELESQYSISDLEIGDITILGIYKGQYIYSNIYEKLNKLSIYNKVEENPESNINYETDETKEEEYTASYNYIDVIAIIQEIIV